MDSGLENEVREIIQVLKDLGKVYLAEQIEKNWQKTVLEYSKELNSWGPERPIEPELLDAFSQELKRLEFDDTSQKNILNSLEKRRILQTTLHVVPAEGPRMLCTNWLGSLGVPSQEFYVVGMFSGVPFSNNHRSGRISGKNGEINLFPSSMQDALVYRSKIPSKLLEKLSALPEKLKMILPEATLGSSYTKWALQACQKIERKVLDKDNLVYLDINEIVAGYLARVLKNRSHVFYKIFFDPTIQEQFTEILRGETIFYEPVLKGKYENMEKMVFSGENLEGKNRKISLAKPEIIIQEIEEGRLCPSLPLVSITLAFLNQFKCFGSFAQVEHLPAYQEKLAKLHFMKTFNIENIPTANFTFGIFPDNTEIFPADLVAEGKKLQPKDSWLFGELLLKVKDRLINPVKVQPLQASE